MANVPAELRYTREHEWAKVEGDRARIGITAFAQEQVVEVNAELPKKPEVVNTDPYGQGWMLVIRMSNPKEVDGLMSAADYEKLTAGAGHERRRGRHALHLEHARPAEGDARAHRSLLDRGPAGPHPGQGAPLASAQPARRDGRDRLRAPPAAAGRTQRGRRRLRVLPRRRLLRSRDPEPPQPPDLPRRVLHRLHPVPAGGEPGHAPLDLRVPDHDGGADRDGRGQRLHLRRGLLAGRSRADGPLG